MKILMNYYSWWIKLKPIPFILITTILNFILMIPVMVVLNLLNIEEEEVGGLNPDNYSIVGLIIITVIIAPILETLLTQLLPIKLIKNLLKYRAELIAIGISAVIFSLMHFGYSIWYSLLTLPLGILLAKTYIIFQNRKESGFWVTTGVHAFRNLIGVISIIGTDKI